MEKLLIAAIAASLIGTSAMAQPWRGQEVARTKVVQNQRGHVMKRVTVRKATPQERRWAQGQRFARRLARDYRVIGTPRAYQLSLTRHVDTNGCGREKMRCWSASPPV